MSDTTKTPYDVIHPKALRLIEAIRPHCARVELAGSLRRRRPEIGDIEIVAIPRRVVDLFGEPRLGPTALDRFLDGHNINFTKRGEKYQQFVYGHYKIDLFLPTAATWGSVFTIRTGSADFSRWLVTPRGAGGAAPDGVTFSNGRLYAEGRLLATPEEEDVFAALGLPWIPPVDRFGPTDMLRLEPVWNFETTTRESTP